jgi:hypothetical protein
LPELLQEFYIYKFTYHLIDLVRVGLEHRGRSDFKMYFLHHLLTAALVFFSYILHFMPVGAAVMLCHDVTDLAVSLFKLTVDVTPFWLQMCGYLQMVALWLYFRIWFFPVHVIGRILEEVTVWPEETFSYNICGMTIGFLMALACMHVFWLYIMVKGVMKRMRVANYQDVISLKTYENTLS